MSAPPPLVWYASYGSNMYSARLRCYLEGGTPSGARRNYVGCRDRVPARRNVASEFPGGVFLPVLSRVGVTRQEMARASAKEAAAAREAALDSPRPPRR